MRGAGRWSRETACHGRRNRRGIGSWPQEGSRHIRTIGAGHSTVREYLRRSVLLVVSGVSISFKSTDLDRCLELEENGLGDEDLPRLGA